MSRMEPINMELYLQILGMIAVLAGGVGGGYKICTFRGRNGNDLGSRMSIVEERTMRTHRLLLGYLRIVAKNDPSPEISDLLLDSQNGSNSGVYGP